MDGLPDGNPYPGLRPFQAEEMHLFFGRDEQRIELLHRLRESRFLAIVGTSGSGKSSLVRAGLLPGLHGGFMAGQSDCWRVVDLRPGTDAIGNLAHALDAPGVLREALAADEPSFTETTLRRSGLGLVEAVREARLPPADKVLVLVDQFEELFRAIEASDRPQSSDDASAFVKLLLEAARQSELPIYVVLTMRSDFLGECSRFRDLPEAINDGQYLVPRLTPDQRAEAITGPAAVFGVTLSSTLVNRLLNDVGENPDQLPILQHALMRTWAQWKLRPANPGAPGVIDLADYESIGGMDRALSLHADAVYAGLAAQLGAHEGAARKAIAERLFKCLAGIGAGGLPVRRLAKLQEIVEVTGAPLPQVVSVIDAFRAPGNSFLMPPAGEPLPPERYIDISHESLIRNWERMRAWVADEAESARIYERLSSTALLHAKDEAALWDQPDLGVALKWRNVHKPNPVWAQRYNAVFGDAMAFLNASHARAQAAEDAKARRRRVWIFSVAVVFFAMLTGMVSWAREELTRADLTAKQSREARAELVRLKAVVDLRNARNARTAGGAALPMCPRPAEPGSTGSTIRQALHDKLCAPDAKLTDDDVRLVEIYEHTLNGRWGDASRVMSQLTTAPAAEGTQGNPHPAALDTQQMLARLAAMRSPADRSERNNLLELRNLGARNVLSPGAEQATVAGMSHPVHRQIARVIANAAERLTKEETLLLDAYQQAEAARAGSGRSTARERGKEIVDELRRQPHGQAYGDLATAALTPESRVIEGLETAMRLLRDNLWSIGIFTIWPLWRLRRYLQRRRGTPIRPRPNPLRRAVAAILDIVIAAGFGVLAATFVESTQGIAASLFKWQDLLAGGNDASLLAGIVAAVAYFLCRDSLRLRFRRSLGKAVFDLRPLVTNAEHPGAITAWASIKRNGLVPAIVMIGTLVLSSIHWILLSGAAVGFLLVNTYLSFVKHGEMLGDRWSKTRLVDADCAESLSVRP